MVSRKRTVPGLPVMLQTPSESIALSWPGAGSAALAELQRRCVEWTYTVRNRSRWIRSPVGSADQDKRAGEFLRDVGVSEQGMRQLAVDGLARVCIPFTSEAEGWEARILPWEFILSAATRAQRSGPMVVTRWLKCKARPTVTDLGKVLFVESAPGRLSQDWDFADECRLVRSYTGATQFERLETPTLEQLRDKVAQFRPGIIHLAGFDNHQGLELLKETPDKREALDGYLMAGPGGVAAVPASELAAALVPNGYAPSLVFCNICGCWQGVPTS